MVSVANTMLISDAPTAAPSGHCTRISSHSATPNLAPRSSALINAPITASMRHPKITRTVITLAASHHWPAIRCRPASGRKMNATQDTATSRDAIPVRPTGRPAAMCGSAPMVMATAATAMTCSGETRVGRWGPGRCLT